MLVLTTMSAVHGMRSWNGYPRIYSFQDMAIMVRLRFGPLGPMTTD